MFRRLAYVDVAVDAGDFSLIDRRVVDAINAMPETHRFLRGLRAWVGFKQIGVPYVRPERMFGTTTNNFRKNLGWARRAIVSFSYAPLDLITGLALIVVAASFVSLLVQLVLRVVDPASAPRGANDPDRPHPLPRRDPATLPGNHRHLPRAHVRGGQATPALRRRVDPQPAGGRRGAQAASRARQAQTERSATSGVPRRVCCRRCIVSGRAPSAAALERTRDNRLDPSRQRQQSRPVADRIAVADRAVATSRRPAAPQQLPDATRREQLHVLDVDDRRTHAQRPIERCTPVVADDR